MTLESSELFGSPDQVALMCRAEHLWVLLQSNPDYSFYGRMVSLSNPGADAFEKLYALAKAQGATSCQYYPAVDADRFCAELKTAGLGTSRYEQCRGGDETYVASKKLLETNTAPSDLTIITVDSETPRDQVADLANLSLSCGVMPVPGHVMRGKNARGVCLLALDSNGKAVATASSYMSNHSSSSHATDAFWGMLATRDDRRGEKIGPLLGAQAIVSMWENYGARAFNTGIVANNSASMTMCKKLGVIPSGWTFIGCLDPDTFGDSSITK